MEYPLEIKHCTEFEGYSILNYYSKGHHDKEDFIKVLKADYEYEGNIDDVFHTNIKLSPSPTRGMMVNYKKIPCKGSFPATVIEV